jgi:ABC-type phosphate transport system permease subunit
MTAQSSTRGQPLQPGRRSLSRRRRWSNGAALAACGLGLALVIAPLIWILGYIVAQGAPALSLDFFTSLPTPAELHRHRAGPPEDQYRRQTPAFRH